MAPPATRTHRLAPRSETKAPGFSATRAAVCGKELLIESSRGYIFCGECYADDRYVEMLVCDRGLSLHVSCIEGVWMSATPTDDELIVALDFEGQVDLF